MDCPHKVPPSGTPAKHHRDTETAKQGQALDTTEKIEKGETGPDHSLDIADIAAPAIMTCTEATPDHNKRDGHSHYRSSSRQFHSAH